MQMGLRMAGWWNLTYWIEIAWVKPKTRNGQDPDVALLRSRKSTPIGQSTVKWHRLECTFNISFMIQSANNPFKLKLFSP